MHATTFFIIIIGNEKIRMLCLHYFIIHYIVLFYPLKYQRNTLKLTVMHNYSKGTFHCSCGKLKKLK